MWRPPSYLSSLWLVLQSGMEEYAREPCPWRIIDDCGGAFSMGLIGGGFFNMIGGAYNAPAGYQRRLMGGIIKVGAASAATVAGNNDLLTIGTRRR